jgi:hypothetical protein
MVNTEKTTNHVDHVALDVKLAQIMLTTVLHALETELMNHLATAHQDNTKMLMEIAKFVVTLALNVPDPQITVLHVNLIEFKDLNQNAHAPMENSN